MRKLTAHLAAALILSAGAFALRASFASDPSQPPPTFHKDIEPILQANCQACHRPGGDNYTGMVAPMALVTYADVRPWAKAIAAEVNARRMPPWHADPEHHGVFSNERTITQAQIDAIVAWSNAGAPRGNPADAPAPRVFPDWDGWRIGVPDMIVNAERFFVEDAVDDLYVTLEGAIDPADLPEDRWIQSLEWRGGSSAVHHITGRYEVRDESGRVVLREGLGSIAPGEEPLWMPEGFAKLMRKGAVIVFSMHYHKEPGEGTGKWDQSQIALKFYPKDKLPTYFVHQNAIVSNSFEIPPHHDNWKVSAARTLSVDTILLKMHPHMHLRGKDALYVAHYPDGTTERLLYVPKWDFNWQTDYSYAEPKLLPAGTRVEYSVHYDNSTDNPANPDPALPIRSGRQTIDEMMEGYMTYAEAIPIDHTKFEASRAALEARAERIGGGASNK